MYSRRPLHDEPTNCESELRLERMPSLHLKHCAKHHLMPPSVYVYGPTQFTVPNTCMTFVQYTHGQHVTIVYINKLSATLNCMRSIPKCRSTQKQPQVHTECSYTSTIYTCVHQLKHSLYTL